jgi:N-acetylneuraminate synthase/sialic acid synthase
MAETGKPIIMSTGAGTMEDVRRAHDEIMPINSSLSILHCTAEYPSDHKDMNLNVVQTYIKEFPEALIGISDHDNGIAMSLVAYVLGARVIEKHFTMNRAWRGTDHAFSLEPEGMRKLVRDVHRAGIAMGDGVKRMYEKEKGPKMKMGKKIVAARNLPAGHLIQPGDLTFKSPGDGVAPYLDGQFYGKKLKVAVSEDEGLKLDHV